MANRNTIYFEALKQIEHRCDMAASNAFMTSKEVTPQERTLALKYRYGAMYTRKRAYRCGHAPNSACLLCGQEDGGHHTASGCPILADHYTSRHNKVARHIVTRLLRGRKAGYLIQMDIGSPSNCEGDGIGVRVPRTIPWHLLPKAVQDAAASQPEIQTRRPDALLYRPRKGRKQATYWIIEVKICRDTDPDSKLSQATLQHQPLIELIRTHDPRAVVKHLPLLIGVTGTIYDYTVESLEDLGVNGPALRKCVKNIHETCIKSLYNIYMAKRKLERALEAKPARKPKS
jgi:hypothetical protein